MNNTDQEGDNSNNDVYFPNLGGRTFSREIPAEYFDGDDVLHSNNAQKKNVSPEQICRIGIVMLAYALFYTLFAGNQTVSSLAAKNLASTEVATIPTVAMFTGAIIVVVPASYIMQTYGRRVGFVIGGVAAILSGGLSFYAIRTNNFPAFIVSGFLLGIFDGFADYLRFAAAEAVSESFQGAAVSIALSGGAICSVLGPLAANIASQHGGYAVYYMVATVVAVLFCTTVFFIKAPQTPKDDDAASVLDSDTSSHLASDIEVDAAPRNIVTILRTPECFVAILCGMASQWAMILIMTALPLGMVDEHNYSFSEYSHVIQFHLLAMFVPGIFTGIAVDRFGALAIVMLGHLTVGLAIFLGLLGYDLIDFGSCLVVLGLGWNFLAIGSTKMLMKTHTPSEAHSVQAAYEFFVFVANGGASFLAGYSIDNGGWRAVLFTAMPLTIVAGTLTLLLILRNLFRWSASRTLSMVSERDGSGRGEDSYMPLHDSFTTNGTSNTEVIKTRL